MNNYQIVNTTTADLDFIYTLFESAIAYQKSKNVPVWAGFDKQVLQDDIRDKRQYKIVNGADFMCIFSLCFSDPIIWGERDKNDAIYLHRFVVNPAFKGQKHVEKIIKWAINFAKTNQIKFIRLDTWGNNPAIIAYYESFGFTFLGFTHTPNSDKLPVQARGLKLALLEIKVD